jgi:hypothetical protein
LIGVVETIHNYSLYFILPTFNVPQVAFATNLACDGPILKLSEAQFKLNLAGNEKTVSFD